MTARQRLCDRRQSETFSADRTAQIRAELKRRLAERDEEILDWLQDTVTEALVECETDTRRKYVGEE
jgi:hypothetical protein